MSILISFAQSGASTGTIQVSASAVAWYGAILSTLALSAAIFNLWRDSKRLEIRVLPNMTGIPDGGSWDVIHVANAGRRPVWITHVWAEKSKGPGEKLLLGTALNRGARGLKEGEFTSYLAKGGQIDWRVFRFVCIVIATGETFRKRVELPPEDRPAGEIEVGPGGVAK